MRKSRQVEKPVSYWVWAPFVFWVILFLDPFPDHFVWNVVILSFTIFVEILLRSPEQLKLLKDANERLDRHRQEINSRIH
jgi:hypothetical protein